MRAIPVREDAVRVRLMIRRDEMVDEQIGPRLCGEEAVGGCEDLRVVVDVDGDALGVGVGQVPRAWEHA